MCVVQARITDIFMYRYLFKVLWRWRSGNVRRLNKLEAHSHKSAHRRLKAFLTSLLVFRAGTSLGGAFCD